MDHSRDSMFWGKREANRKDEGKAQGSDGSYREKYLAEQERTAKLWDAYQTLERALKVANDRIRALEQEIEDLKEKYGHEGSERRNMNE